MARHRGLVAYLSNGRAHITVKNLNADGELRGVKEIRISVENVGTKTRRKRLPFGITSFALDFTVKADAVARAGYRVGDEVVILVTHNSMFDDDVDPTTEPTMDSQPKRALTEQVRLPPKKMFKFLHNSDSQVTPPVSDEDKKSEMSREMRDKLVLSDGDYAREIGTRSRPSSVHVEDDMVAAPDQDTVRRMSKEVCKWWLKRLGADTCAVDTSSRQAMQAALHARLGVAMLQQ